MSDPGAPTPTPPPSYDEHRAAAAQRSAGPTGRPEPYRGFNEQYHQQYGRQYGTPQPPFGTVPQRPYSGPNPWPVQPAPERKPGTNGFAIAALVFGIIGGIPLAIIFGVIALGQTANGRQQGRGQAIAGLICAGVWLAGLAAVGVYNVATEPERDDSGSITDGGTLSAYDIEIGDCLNGLRAVEYDTLVTSLPAVPCADPHEGEVYASFELAEGAYPGLDGVVAAADQRCAQALATYSASAWEDPNIGLFYLYPDERGWRQTREVVCIALAIEGTLTGSLSEQPDT